MTEAELQAAIVEAARLLGWLVYHTHDSRRSEPGFPDLCMVKNTTLLFAELKAGKRKVTPEQQTWLDRLARVHRASRDIEFGHACVKVFVWRDTDWVDGTVDRILRLPH